MMKIIKPLTWTLLTIFFGLLQLWSVLIWSHLDKSVAFSSIEVIKDCGILFFCTSIMTAFALDFMIKKKSTRNLSTIGVVYILPPMLCLIFSILIYSVYYFGTPEESITTNFQYVIFAFSALYMTVIKYLDLNKIIK